MTFSLAFVLGVLEMFLKCDYGDGKMVQWFEYLLLFQGIGLES